MTMEEPAVPVVGPSLCGANAKVIHFVLRLDTELLITKVEL
jgi:hypothetical protein